MVSTTCAMRVVTTNVKTRKKELLSHLCQWENERGDDTEHQEIAIRTSEAPTVNENPTKFVLDKIHLLVEV